MAKYRITEKQMAVKVWVHYVEADDEESAMEKLYKAKVLDTYFFIEDNNDEMPWVEDIEEVKE